VAAAAAVYAVLPGVAGAALGAALIARGAAAAWSRALLGAAGSVRAIELGGGAVAFRLSNGESRAAPIAARRYVSRYMVVLPYGRNALLVSADMLGAQEFRRLRIWALWNRIPADGRGVAAEQRPA
jgi:hypothetical protein